jgi:hypothetical protein
MELTSIAPGASMIKRCLWRSAAPQHLPRVCVALAGRGVVTALERTPFSYHHRQHRGRWRTATGRFFTTSIRAFGRRARRNEPAAKGAGGATLERSDGFHISGASPCSLLDAMSPRIRRPLIPEPVGLDDPTKTAAGHAERTWEALAKASTATSACIVAAAVAGAVVVAPVAPFLAAFAAVAGGFNLRARWAREDPPRPDFQKAVKPPRRRLDPTPVLLPAYPA